MPDRSGCTPFSAPHERRVTQCLTSRPVQLTVRTTTKATPPKNVKFIGETLAAAAATPGEIVLSDVPAYKWRDGCGPTAVGMIVGYWDTPGYPDLVPSSAAARPMPRQQDDHESWDSRVSTALRGLLAAAGDDRVFAIGRQERSTGRRRTPL